MCLQLLSVKYIPREHPGIKNELFRGQEEPFPNGWSLSEALLEAIYVVNHAALFTLLVFFYYIYITPVNNLHLGVRKPQSFTNIYNEQYN